MTTATLAYPSASYFSNLSRAADNLVGAVFSIKLTEFAACFREARAMGRVVREEGIPVTARQMQALRAAAGVEQAAN
jgi:hypothetical protein